MYITKHPYKITTYKTILQINTINSINLTLCTFAFKKYFKNNCLYYLDRYEQTHCALLGFEIQLLINMT